MTTRGRLRALAARAWVGVVALPLGCNSAASDDGFDFSTESNGLTTTAGSTGSGDETGTGGESTGDTTAGTDDGSGSESSTGELPPAEPCTAVDIIFVVDDSEPMAEEQARLQAAALAFVQQVQTSIPTLLEDVQIGVLTTDDELFVQANAEPCGPYEGGNNWMVSSSTALATELSCALGVGVAGSPNERPMDMLLGSLSDDNLAPGGFHSGFLREEALLVVVLATNEEDEFEVDTSWGSAGDPPQWVETIAGRKGGWTQDVVVLSLLGIPEPNACLAPWDGTEGAQHAPRLIEFTESFPQGAVGDICADEYGTFLASVVPGVTAACAGYIPP